MSRWTIAVALLIGLVDAAGAAPRLEYRGRALTARQVEPLFGEALRAPGDSVALASALGRLCARLEDEGYLDARATAVAQATPGGRAPGETAGSPLLRVEVNEGPRYRIVRLDCDTPAGDTTGIADAFTLRTGDWASPAALEEAATRALQTMATKGYPYAKLTVSGFDWDSAGARVRVSATPGPRVTVTGARIEGLRATRPQLAERALGRALGAPYSPAAAESGRERLLQLGLFRSVVWEGLAGEPDWGRARLAYRVEELHYNRFEGAVGSSSQGRMSGLARFDLANLAGTGRAVGASWESRGQGVEIVAARYVEPLLLGAPLRAEGTLEQQREDTLFTRARWGARLHFLLSGHERIEAGYEQDRVLQPHSAVSEARLQSTVFALERDTRDAVLVARRGARVRLSASQTFKREILVDEGRASARSSTVEGLADWHRATSAHAGIAWQVSGAGRFSSQPVLSLFERFPLGGAATLRGFDEQAFRVDRYLLSRFELRWFPGPTGQHVALFWDHAWTFTRLAEELGTRVEQRQHDGVGFGLRFESPTGLIGVDYGLEPGRPPVEGKLHVQLVSSF
jgi:translocation and assembly module TamA